MLSEVKAESCPIESITIPEIWQVVQLIMASGEESEAGQQGHLVQRLQTVVLEVEMGHTGQRIQRIQAAQPHAVESEPRQRQNPLSLALAVGFARAGEGIAAGRGSC